MLKTLAERQVFSICYLFNNEITNIKVQLISIKNCKINALFNTKIYNVDFTAPSEEALITVKGGGFDTTLQLINFDVKNVKVRHSIFFIQQAKAIATKATFKNISKIHIN